MNQFQQAFKQGQNHHLMNLVSLTHIRYSQLTQQSINDKVFEAN